MWDKMKRCGKYADDIEKSEKRVNKHNMLVYIKKRTPKIMTDRDFLNRCVWKKEDEEFVLVTNSEKSDARLITDSVVRGNYPSAMRIKRKKDKETTLEYVIHPDAGGHLKGWTMNRYLGSNLCCVKEIQELFPGAEED